MPNYFPPPSTYKKRTNYLKDVGCLTRSSLELLAEHDQLDLIVDGQDTSTGNTTEDVGTSSLEEGLDTLLGDDLASSIEGRLVLDGLTTREELAFTPRLEG